MIYLDHYFYCMPNMISDKVLMIFTFDFGAQQCYLQTTCLHTMPYTVKAIYCSSIYFSYINISMNNLWNNWHVYVPHITNTFEIEIQVESMHFKIIFMSTKVPFSNGKKNRWSRNVRSKEFYQSDRFWFEKIKLQIQYTGNGSNLYAYKIFNLICKSFL